VLPFVIILAYALIGFITGFMVLVRSKINVKAWQHEPVGAICVGAALFWPIVLPIMGLAKFFQAVDAKAEEIAKKHRI